MYTGKGKENTWLTSEIQATEEKRRAYKEMRKGMRLGKLER